MSYFLDMKDWNITYHISSILINALFLFVFKKTEKKSRES